MKMASQLNWKLMDLGSPGTGTHVTKVISWSQVGIKRLVINKAFNLTNKIFKAFNLFNKDSQEETINCTWSKESQ